MDPLLQLAPTVNGRPRISIYQPEQEGLIFPEIPDFTSHEEERQYRKEHLVAACRAFALHSLDYGFAGHLTVRDPEFPELYWTNPMAVHFSQVKLSNLILADHTGKVVEGDYAINRAGFVLHAAVHEAHPDIVAMCHAHTVYGVAFAALAGLPLRPITQDAAVFFEDHVVITRRGRRGRGRSEAGQVGRRVFPSVQGRDPPESRPADREPPQHRGGRLLVHRAGTLLPAAVADRRHRHHSRSWSRRSARATAANMSAANTSAGCTFQPSMTNSLLNSRTCSLKDFPAGTFA